MTIGLANVRIGEWQTNEMGLACMNGERKRIRPNYGLDAPAVVVGFGLLGGVLTILAVSIRWWIENPSWRPFLFLA
ncbi:hypothetical protein [Polycladomyces subterraneus]|uniref:Uncharacterized protein n=1 Tax=Polycladomyces subterraneus TaxID=1016997 RepID=A0ABT8IPZ8_9BACL|nr:hypothetical protein [Polycladomyces subterraneus]MDN4594858.1 hypothetical protein [Polycladomyces subterraneus]